MFGQQDVQELLAFEAGEGKVTSLYLDTDLTKQTSETIKLQTRALLKECEVSKEDADAIEAYLDLSYEWNQPGLAVFSCQQSDFFRAYPSNVAFRNRLRLGKTPHVKPLTHLLDHYAHYGVIVVDRIGDRFFEYHLGELRDSAGTMCDEIRKLKVGGGSSRGGSSTSATGQRGGQGGRHEEEVALRNMRDSAAVAQRFFDNKPIRRLFLGGTSENVAQFREQLARKYQSRLAGTFPIDMTAGEHEIRERSLQLLKEVNARREQKLVQQLITTAAKGGNGVVGLPATLRAVSEGRVQTLIISDGYRRPGYTHPETNYLTAFINEAVSFDPASLAKVDDIVDLAVSRTMEQGGHVELVADSEELENAGQIGALLRY